jgi:molybdopterin biosynthesis enzyme MoaB
MRGVAGVHNRTIIVNFPGSLKAALLCARTLIPLIVHASDLLHGKKRESFEPGFMGLNAK